MAATEAPLERDCINIEPPTASEIAAHPREFALLVQAAGAAPPARVAAQMLREYVDRFGARAPLPSDLSTAGATAVPFASFVQLLKPAARAEQHAAGSGSCVGMAARDLSGTLSPYRFDRRPVGETDVRLQVAFCGLCATDLHQLHNEWNNAILPMVPGHEVVGIVTQVGSGVTRFSPGDRVGVGFMVRSCASCGECERGQEQFCGRRVYTFNARDWGQGGAPTLGGFSSHMVVDERFVLHIPPGLALHDAAPLLCAGITTYSPLRHFGLDKPGTRLGVAGLGGLGHLAVRLAKALGCHVTVISHSDAKRGEALEALGADAFVCSARPAELRALAGSLDGVLDCVSAAHDMAPLLQALRVDGRLVLLGVPEGPLELRPFDILPRRLSLAGSIIGGVAETGELLQLCAARGIAPMVEVLPLEAVNDALVRLAAGDVHYRFVLDARGLA